MKKKDVIAESFLENSWTNAVARNPVTTLSAASVCTTANHNDDLIVGATAAAAAAAAAATGTSGVVGTVTSALPNNNRVSAQLLCAPSAGGTY